MLFGPCPSVRPVPHCAPPSPVPALALLHPLVFAVHAIALQQLSSVPSFQPVRCGEQLVDRGAVLAPPSAVAAELLPLSNPHPPTPASFSPAARETVRPSGTRARCKASEGVCSPERQASNDADTRAHGAVWVLLVLESGCQGGGRCGGTLRCPAVHAARWTPALGRPRGQMQGPLALRARSGAAHALACWITEPRDLAPGLLSPSLPGPAARPPPPPRACGRCVQRPAPARLHT